MCKVVVAVSDGKGVLLLLLRLSLCAARVHLFFPFSGRPKGSRVRPVARPRSRRRGPRGFHPSFSPATGGAVHGCDLPSGVRGKLEMGPSFVLA